MKSDVNGCSTVTVLAWHFVGYTLRDGRPVPADGKSQAEAVATLTKQES